LNEAVSVIECVDQASRSAMVRSNEDLKKN
jgi:hypothetical protein